MTGLFSTTVCTFILRGLVFANNCNTSRTIEVTTGPGRLFPLATFVAFFSAFNDVFYMLLRRVPFVDTLDRVRRSLVFLLIVYVLCILVLVLLGTIFGTGGQAMEHLNITTFGALILTMPFVGCHTAFNVTRTVNMNVNSKLTFVITILVVGFKLHHLMRGGGVPRYFGNAPTMFVCISVLTLTFSNISNGKLSLWEAMRGNI